jgi:hypothetical protein
MPSGSNRDVHALQFLEMKNIGYYSSCWFLIILYKKNLFEIAWSEGIHLINKFLANMIRYNKITLMNISLLKS